MAGKTEPPSDRHVVRGTIVRFENKMAIVAIDHQLEIHWPIKYLPDHCQAGTAVSLSLSTSTSDEQERTQLAKAILNTILHPQT